MVDGVGLRWDEKLVVRGRLEWDGSLVEGGGLERGEGLVDDGKLWWDAGLVVGGGLERGGGLVRDEDGGLDLDGRDERVVEG